MAIIWTDVVALAPEMAATAVTTQNDILAYVNTALAVSLYDGDGGVTSRLARIFYAAHLAALAKRGAGGAVISASADGLSRGYAPPLSSANLAQTSYGLAFQRLIPPAAHGPFVL